MEHRKLIFVLLLVFGISLPSLSGLLIVPFSLVFSSYVLAYTLGLAVLFLEVSLLLWRRQSLRQYWQALFAFFVVARALFVDFLVNLPSNTTT